VIFSQNNPRKNIAHSDQTVELFFRENAGSPKTPEKRAFGGFADNLRNGLWIFSRLFSVVFPSDAFSANQNVNSALRNDCANIIQLYMRGNHSIFLNFRTCIRFRKAPESGALQ